MEPTTLPQISDLSRPIWSLKGRFAIGVPQLLYLVAAGLLTLGVAVKISWLYRPMVFEANQAAWDAYYYHVPQINEFIAHRFRPDYENFIAMAPGLHLLYAYLARGLGIQSFAYDSGLLFAIHSVWMVTYLALSAFIILNVSRRNGSVLLPALPLLASSYPTYSWIWPTTDLPATDLYLLVVAVEFRTWSEKPRLLFYAVVGAAGALLRQHYVFLAAVPAGMLVANAVVEQRRLDLKKFFVYLLPVTPGLAILAYFVSIWHGLVPPDQAYHLAPFSEPIALAHLFGFTGLIGLPFAVSLWWMLSEPSWSTSDRGNPSWLVSYNRATIRLVIAAAACGLLAVALLPLNYSVDSGRYGSMFWTIEHKLHSPLIRDAYLWSAISLGAAIWFAVGTLSIRNRQIIPTVVLFAMYAGTLLVQEYCFQRYVEEPILLTLAVFILWSTRLPKHQSLLWAVCFGGYILLGWAKLFHGFGSLAR